MYVYLTFLEKMLHFLFRRFFLWFWVGFGHFTSFFAALRRFCHLTTATSCRCKLWYLTIYLKSIEYEYLKMLSTYFKPRIFLLLSSSSLNKSVTHIPWSCSFDLICASWHPRTLFLDTTWFLPCRCWWPDIWLSVVSVFNNWRETGPGRAPNYPKQQYQY